MFKHYILVKPTVKEIPHGAKLGMGRSISMKDEGVFLSLGGAILVPKGWDYFTRKPISSPARLAWEKVVSIIRLGPADRTQTA